MEMNEIFKSKEIQMNYTQKLINANFKSKDNFLKKIYLELAVVCNELKHNIRVLFQQITGFYDIKHFASQKITMR